MALNVEFCMSFLIVHKAILALLNRKYMLKHGSYHGLSAEKALLKRPRNACLQVTVLHNEYTSLEQRLAIKYRPDEQREYVAEWCIGLVVMTG